MIFTIFHCTFIFGFGLKNSKTSVSWAHYNSCISQDSGISASKTVIYKTLMQLTVLLFLQLFYKIRRIYACFFTKSLSKGLCIAKANFPGNGAYGASGLFYTVTRAESTTGKG